MEQRPGRGRPRPALRAARRGCAVLSRRSPPSTGGRFFAARRSSDLAPVYAEIDRLERPARSFRRARARRDRPEPWLADRGRLPARRARAHARLLAAAPVSGVVHPEWLVPAAGLLLGVALALGLARRRAARRLARLLGGEARACRGPRRDAALLLALAALLAALVGPRVGSASGGCRPPASTSRCSSTSRAAWTRATLRRVDSRAPCARRTSCSRSSRPATASAIAAFASRGVLLTPLTPDHDALRELLGGLDTELIQPRGSALAARRARGARPPSRRAASARACCSCSPTARTRSGGRDLPLAELARAEVRVLAAAFGSEEGAMLSDHGDAARDASGLPVVTRRSLEPLERLAEATGGEVFRATPSARSRRACSRDRCSATRGARAASSCAASARCRCCPSPRSPSRCCCSRACTVSRLPHKGVRALLATTALLPLAAGPLAQAGRAAAPARGTREARARRQRRGGARAARRRPWSRAIPRSPRSPTTTWASRSSPPGRLEEARLAFFDALALDPEDAHGPLRSRVDAGGARAPAAAEPRRSRERAARAEASRGAAPEAPRSASRSPLPGRGAKPRRPRPRSAREERQRLLDRVPDDPSRALRLAARSGAGEAVRAGRAGVVPATRSASPRGAEGDSRVGLLTLHDVTRLGLAALALATASASFAATDSTPACRASAAACRPEGYPGSAAGLATRDPAACRHDERRMAGAARLPGLSRRMAAGAARAAR